MLREEAEVQEAVGNGFDEHDVVVCNEVQCDILRNYDLPAKHSLVVKGLNVFPR